MALCDATHQTQSAAVKEGRTGRKEWAWERGRKGRKEGREEDRKERKRKDRKEGREERAAGRSLKKGNTITNSFLFQRGRKNT